MEEFPEGSMTNPQPRARVGLSKSSELKRAHE
jgi:hypothetical protein